MRFQFLPRLPSKVVGLMHIGLMTPELMKAKTSKQRPIKFKTFANKQDGMVFISVAQLLKNSAR